MIQYITETYHCKWCGEDLTDKGQDWLDHFTRTHFDKLARMIEDLVEVRQRPYKHSYNVDRDSIK